MADTGSGEARRNGQGSRRARQQPGRPFRVHFSLTAEEFAALDDAAGRAGLARGAFTAQVVLAHVTGGTDGPEAPQRELLRELVRAAGLVRRIGINLNQAVAKLNATGQLPGELPWLARESMRIARRVDETAEQARKALR
jgi:hypothetical protein